MFKILSLVLPLLIFQQAASASPTSPKLSQDGSIKICSALVTEYISEKLGRHKKKTTDILIRLTPGTLPQAAVAIGFQVSYSPFDTLNETVDSPVSSEDIFSYVKTLNLTEQIIAEIKLSQEHDKELSNHKVGFSLDEIYDSKVYLVEGTDKNYTLVEARKKDGENLGWFLHTPYWSAPCRKTSSKN